MRKMPDQVSRIFFERAIMNRHVKITMRILDIWCTTYNLKRDENENVQQMEDIFRK